MNILIYKIYLPTCSMMVWNKNKDTRFYQLLVRKKLNVFFKIPENQVSHCFGHV